MEFREQLGEKVCTLRKALGMTQEELAHRSGLTTAYVGLIERGKRNASLDTIYGLTYGLGVRISDLMEFADDGERMKLDADSELLLALFRGAEEHDRNTLLMIAKGLYELRWAELDNPSSEDDKTD